MKNEYGETLDRSGYAPSIVQRNMTRCYMCNAPGLLERHEVFGAANRDKSKRLGLWVHLCTRCHRGVDGVHFKAEKMQMLHEQGQRAAMEEYGWTVDEFRKKIGKNYIEEDA